jgi:hypothetical protein
VGTAQVFVPGGWRAGAAPAVVATPAAATAPVVVVPRDAVRAAIRAEAREERRERREERRERRGR